MPLRTLDPHAGVQERVAAELQRGRLVSLASDALGGTSADSVGMAAPHPMFNLGLDAIDSADWMQRVEMTGWRYFVTSNSGVVATVEASSSSPDGPINGTLTNEGPFVLGSEQALILSETQMEISNGSYILGLLRIPALYVIALWLRSDHDPEKLDRFVPVAPAPNPLIANALMDPIEFGQGLRHLKSLKAASGGNDSVSN